VFEIVSGWSIYEKLACPYCMENNKAFTLINNDKPSFSYCHRRFLQTNHNYSKSIKDFFIGKVKRNVAPPIPSSEDLYDMVS
jgi:hypothetical protein